MRRLYSDSGKKRLFSQVATLTILLALSPFAHAHPELLAQIEVLTERLEEHPGDAKLMLKRGDLYRRHGDYDAAQRDFSNVNETDSPPPELDFFEGRLHLDTGQAEAAVISFSRYLADHPKHVKTLVLRAEALSVLHQPTDAASDLRRAVRYSENPSPALYRQQALALVVAGTDRWREARKVIDDGLSRFPIEVSLLRLGTDIALALDETESAWRYINALPETIRELPQWQARLDLANNLVGAEPADRPFLLREARENLESQALR